MVMNRALTVAGFAAAVFGAIGPATAQGRCDVTMPTAEGYGSEQLLVLGLWPKGDVIFKPGGAGFVTNDGALGMKFGWNRGVRGKLQIEGRRLDGTAAPLRSEVPNGYGDIGFQSSYVIFPTPGCWEVTARVGEAQLVFVTRVTKIGDGPSWRRGL